MCNKAVANVARPKPDNTFGTDSTYEHYSSTTEQLPRAASHLQYQRSDFSDKKMSKKTVH